MTHRYNVSTFRAESLQTLRNVKVHSPSIIQIVSGSKRLHAKEVSLDVFQSELLLCDANESLSFENRPHSGRFLSRMFSFYQLPTESMLELSRSNAKEQVIPIFKPNNALRDALNALYSFDLVSLSQETQSYWVLGLYQQLAEYGVLHYMFPSVDTSFAQLLKRYLEKHLGDEVSLIHAAEHFSISRSTLIRKLKQENTTFRQELVEVRLNYALSLMQTGQRNVAMLAQLCGYQSEERFSQRFKIKFGVSPSEYMKTVTA